jgi:hypothetical protein
MPLPGLISSSLLEPIPSAGSACPSRDFQEHHVQRARTKPFFTVADHSITHDVPAALKVIEKLQFLDCQPNVFTMMAHDKHLLEVVDLFPEKANDWREKNWADTARWRFLRDLVSLECH